MRTAVLVTVVVLSVVTVVGLQTEASPPSPSMVPEATPTLSPEAYLPLVMRLYPVTPTPTPVPTSTPTPSPDWCEPNDAPAEACEIGAGVYQALVASDTDQDWYRFTTTVTRTVDIFLDGPDGDDYDLYLYGDPAGDPVAYSVTPGTPDESLSALLGRGEWYVLVFPIRSTGVRPYTLVVTMK